MWSKMLASKLITLGWFSLIIRILEQIQEDFWFSQVPLTFVKKLSFESKKKQIKNMMPFLLSFTFNISYENIVDTNEKLQ